MQDVLDMLFGKSYEIIDGALRNEVVNWSDVLAAFKDHGIEPKPLIF